MSKITRSILYGRKVIPTINDHHAERMVCQKIPDQLEKDAAQPETERVFKPSNYQEELRNAKPYEEMPRLPLIPFFGSSWQYFPVIGKYSSSNMYDADLRKQRTYGDIVRERFGKLEFVSSYHPVSTELLGVHEGKYPSRAEFLTLKTYREKRKYMYQVVGLVAMQGKDWGEFRSEVQKHAYFISAVADRIVADVAKDFIKLADITKDSKNEVPDMISILKKWALESVVAVSLDTRLNLLDPKIDPESDGMKMIKSVQTQLECMNKLEPSSGNFPFWKYIPTPTWIKFIKAADVFTELVFQYIKESMNNFFVKPGSEHDVTILQRMLMDRSLRVSATMVAVADIIMAGIDTTSHATAYLLFCLAKNPEKQQLLYEEVMTKFPDKEERLIYKRLKYFNQCFHEAMRLYPVIRGNLRIFDRDVVIQNYRIPSGVAVLSVQQIFGRDERFYERPNEFLPERFEEKQVHILPFGIGKRQCLGKVIAHREIFMLVAEVLRNYRVECDDDDIELVTRLVNVPAKPLRMKFIKR